MDLDIHNMNARSWVTLVLSTLKSGLIETIGKKPTIRKYFGRKKDNNAIVQHAVDYIVLQEKEK